MDQLQYRASHNSYWRNRPPNALIDDYNIWEVEIDFGIKSGVWRVGHDDVQSQFGLDLLSDWLANVSSAQARFDRPIFVKLEAKNPKDHCDWPFCSLPCCGWGWTEWDHWPLNWAQADIKPIIEDAFGTEQGDAPAGRGLFTPAKLQAWRAANRMTTEWPPLSYVREHGPFVVFLFDNLGADTQVTPDDHCYFTTEFDGLNAVDAVADECNTYADELGTGVVRIRLDGDPGNDHYAEPWSFVLANPPLPSRVVPRGSSHELGTTSDPFTSIGFAVNAHRSAAGVREPGRILVTTGTYPERLTITAPVALEAVGGPAVIGGPDVAYTVTVRLRDAVGSGTAGTLRAHVVGTQGTAPVVDFSGDAALDDDGCARTAHATGTDLGLPTSLVFDLTGSDQAVVGDVWVEDSARGRFEWHGTAGVGGPAGNRVELPLTAIP